MAEKDTIIELIEGVRQNFLRDRETAFLTTTRKEAHNG